MINHRMKEWRHRVTNKHNNRHETQPIGPCAAHTIRTNPEKRTRLYWSLLFSSLAALEKLELV